MKNFLKIAAIVFVVFGSYSFLIEPNFLLTTTFVNLNFSSLPKDFKGFRILQITDLHFGGSPFSIIYNLTLERVKSLHPDIIVVTGDLITKKEAISQAINFLNSLAKIAPTYIVFGNWDHWEGISEEKIKSSNATLLLNSNVFLIKNKSYICLAGVDDPYTGFDNISKALSKNCSFTILLAHSPQIIGEVKTKVNLVLAGHTHGGQVVFPIVGALFVPLPKEYRNFVYGLFQVNSTYMFVSRGIGTRLLPIRFLCSPEVAVIELN